MAKDLVELLRQRLVELEQKLVRPGYISYGAGFRVYLWPEYWRCQCGTVAPMAKRGQQYSDDLVAAWDHLDSHLPPRRKPWWRR